MPSSTIEFITTEDFGMGVQFWNNKIATANKNLERKLGSSAKLQNGRNFRKILLKKLSRVSFVDRQRAALTTTTATATRTSKKQYVDDAKQQLCTCITLFCTFLYRPCKTTTWKCLIASFMEDIHTFTLLRIPKKGFSASLRIIPCNITLRRGRLGERDFLNTK